LGKGTEKKEILKCLKNTPIILFQTAVVINCFVFAGYQNQSPVCVVAVNQDEYVIQL
jgi:hypothetical protein